MERSNYRLSLAYDGAAFAGWQQQPGARTVESTLVEALRPILPSLKGMAVGGRTDRGVHATGQVASFWTLKKLDPDEIAERANRAAPDALWVSEVRPVGPSFHAQFSASSRRYAYFLPDEGVLDPVRLERLLLPLLGTHSFAAFARDTPRGAKTVRRLTAARVRATEDGARPMLRFDFAGDGFLRRQIRVMVATAVREAQAGSPADALLAIALSEDRRRTANPADPSHLVLTGIGYEPYLKIRGGSARIG